MPLRRTGRVEGLGLVDRQIRHDDACDAGVARLVEERLEPAAEHGIHVRHHGDGDVERGVADRREDVGRTGAGGERGRRRLLDHAAVHHRVGVRHPDLDRVGAGVGAGPAAGPASTPGKPPVT